MIGHTDLGKLGVDRVPEQVNAVGPMDAVIHQNGHSIGLIGRKARPSWEVTTSLSPALFHVVGGRGISRVTARVTTR
jgi:hypothetical protein